MLLKFMMLRAIKPLEMTAGGVYVMNIENFGWVITDFQAFIILIIFNIFNRIEIFPSKAC